MSWLRRLPARKLVGFACGCAAGATATAFLVKAFLIWSAVPEGVIPLIGLLGGIFGGYAGSSIAGDFARRDHDVE